IIPTSRPSGIYTAQIMGIKSSAIFKGDTLVLNDEFEGKRIFEYKISNDGDIITCINVVTEKEYTNEFKYIKHKDYEIVVIGSTNYVKE
ncbi:hypothetical protein ACFLVF_00370, partial [Chloroflexota bacterium]